MNYQFIILEVVILFKTKRANIPYKIFLSFVFVDPIFLIGNKLLMRHGYKVEQYEVNVFGLGAKLSFGKGKDIRHEENAQDNMKLLVLTRGDGAISQL